MTGASPELHRRLDEKTAALGEETAARAVENAYLFQVRARSQAVLDAARDLYGDKVTVELVFTLHPPSGSLVDTRLVMTVITPE